MVYSACTCCENLSQIGLSVLEIYGLKVCEFLDPKQNDGTIGFNLVCFCSSWFLLRLHGRERGGSVASNRALPETWIQEFFLKPHLGYCKKAFITSTRRHPIIGSKLYLQCINLIYTTVVLFKNTEFSYLSSRRKVIEYSLHCAVSKYGIS